MRKRKYLAAALVMIMLVTMLNGCKKEVAEEVAEEVSEEVEMEEAKKVISAMTLEEKVAQLFIITPEALTDYKLVYRAGATTEEAIDRYPVGGLIYMAQNLQTPEQVSEMVMNVQKFSEERIGLPMFISVDEEGGAVSRFGKNPAFSLGEIEPMSSIGETGDSQKAYEIGVKIGSFLNEMGFNMDYAPVADVITNPANTVIGSRAFGTDCELVSEMVCAEMKGFQEQNVIPVIKHYPGHGATEADTHKGYAYTNKTLDEMMENELVPFADAIGAGAEVIMAAHISCPSIIGDDTPTSMSEMMITDILRGKMGYKGVVVTDALNMGAIAEEYTSSQAAVQALQAGVDILLMPEDFQEAYEGVLMALENGELTEERIDESVLRIVDLKLKML